MSTHYELQANWIFCRYPLPVFDGRESVKEENGKVIRGSESEVSPQII
jgi:hypothetical protein